jgi:hypothetical protein
MYIYNNKGIMAINSITGTIPTSLGNLSWLRPRSVVAEPIQHVNRSMPGSSGSGGSTHSCGQVGFHLVTVPTKTQHCSVTPGTYKIIQPGISSRYKHSFFLKKVYKHSFTDASGC